MTASHMSFRRIVTVAVQQIALAALLFLLVIGWLHIPDANAAEVAASIVIALLIAVVLGAGESAIALRTTGRASTVRRLLIGAGAVMLAALLWYAVSLGTEHLGANDPLRAGYFNSRFPASLRNAFSYSYILLWQGWLWFFLRWLAAGLLAAAAFACVTCGARVRGFLVILHSPVFLLSLLLLAIVREELTPTLLGWTPGHGLAKELTGLLLRILLVIALNAAAVAALLQAMADAVLRDQRSGTGEPPVSHPRTADIP